LRYVKEKQVLVRFTCDMLTFVTLLLSQIDLFSHLDFINNCFLYVASYVRV
jgi:hypothetical protein